MQEILAAILIGWIVSILSFPTLPLQHWINSSLRVLWMKITFKSIGLNGTWVGVYYMPIDGASDERRVEIIKCNHLSGGEVRGTIKDEITDHKYRFLGKVVFDELVAHYWTTDEERDIGNFKFEIESRSNILSGPLTVYDSVAKTTKPDVQYKWHRKPTWFASWKEPVIAGRSVINNNGVFANNRFRNGEKIGDLALGKAKEQGAHTIQLNNEHREVKAPWMYINHACVPNAVLEWKEKTISLNAASDILPHEEITMDYRLLPELVSSEFTCRCSKCVNTGSPEIIGKSA